MGAGIAQLAIEAGFETVGREVSIELAEKARDRIAHFLQRKVDKEQMGATEREHALGALTLTTDLADLAHCDLVIEAIVEDLGPKLELFRALEGIVRPDAILATNTSALSVTEIAASVSTPERVVGMHFFNPAHIIKLLEVVVGPATAPEATAAARELGVRMGKEPIVVRDSPGFASSRLGLVIGLEAMRMLEGGVASAEDIDKAMTLGYGHPVGPLKLSDMIGLDVRLAIAQYLEKEIGPAFAPPRVLRDHVAAGRLGKKPGEGFYVWDGETAIPRH
jgi:3-hydroxybutyryl-CoA dehydrogenase